MAEYYRNSRTYPRRVFCEAVTEARKLSVFLQILKIGIYLESSNKVSQVLLGLFPLSWRVKLCKTVNTVKGSLKGLKSNLRADKTKKMFFINMVVKGVEKCIEKYKCEINWEKKDFIGR